MMLLRLGGGCFLTLTLVACSGSGDEPGSSDGVTESTVTSSEGVTVGVVTEAGVIVHGADGIVVDVPPGALPPGAEVGVEAVDSLGGATELSTVGSAYRIETDGDPSEPVALQVPVPNGEDSEGLALAHSRDGRVDLVGGQVVNGVFHTALVSFSDVQLVRGRIETILDIADVADEWTLDGISGDSKALAVEAIQIATGQRSEPVPRIVSIVGPTEAVPGRPAVYTATGFESAHPEFLEYEWRLSGRNEAGVTTDGLVQRSLFVGFQSTGRYVVTVDVRDPVTGAEAFAALTVFVDEEEFGVYAVPDLMGAPRVEVGVVNSVGDVDLIWHFSNGAGGTQTIATKGEVRMPGKAVVYGPVFFGTEFRGEDLLFDVAALDSARGTATTAVVLPAPRDGPTAMISGPITVEAETPAAFTAVVANTEGMELEWSASNADRIEGAGESATVSWQDPAEWSRSAGGGVGLVVLSGIATDGERVDLDWHFVTVLPSTDAAGKADEPTPAVETLAFPRSYSGGGSATWSLSWSNGSCLVEGNTLDLTLNADGTLGGLYGRTEPTFSSKTPPGAARPTMECGEQVFVFDPIEVTGRHTPPDPQTGATGTVSVEIVGWPEWHIEGEYSASEMVFDWELSLVATAYEGDAPDPRIVRAIDYQLPLTKDG
jgi:hypothetical protein